MRTMCSHPASSHGGRPTICIIKKVLTLLDASAGGALLVVWMQEGGLLSLSSSCIWTRTT